MRFPFVPFLLFVADKDIGGTSGDSDVWFFCADPSPFEEVDEGAGTLSADPDVGSLIGLINTTFAFKSLTNNEMLY